MGGVIIIIIRVSNIRNKTGNAKAVFPIAILYERKMKRLHTSMEGLEEAM